MKLGTVIYRGAHRLAAPLDAETVDLLPDLMGISAQNMLSLTENWSIAGENVKDAVGPAEPVPINEGQRAPPIPQPMKIACIALNNGANKDRIIKGPNHPAGFIKPSSSLVRHGQPIRLRTASGRAHPEPDLAIIIGTGGAGISVGGAYDHVFGYTTINDLTAPLMRAEDTFHDRAIHPKESNPFEIEYLNSWVSYPGRYKRTDTFEPIGPWIATRNTVSDQHDLIVRRSHRDKVVPEDSTAKLAFEVSDVVNFKSSYMTLEMGDIILMDTALKKAGSDGLAVQDVDLTSLGGPIEVTISGIGTLANPVEVRT
ncbi:fumarylacetoacetate hydrolase family protein [Caballeronia sp. DA-9]|uniref:fumarylacetoacetate hydrolase family protein n=1 Tax=Caballeronia sp. DA-9 TaxID=3436237 RepID=UPI003F6709F5